MATPAVKTPRPSVPLRPRSAAPGSRSHRKLNWMQRTRIRVQRAHARRIERRSARRFWAGRHPVAAGTIVVVLALTPVWVSLSSAVTNPSLGASVPARFAEWLRDHGGSSVVVWAENEWYSHHPPPVGGRPPNGAIPLPPTKTGSGSATGSGSYLPEPKPIKPLASPPIAGEGQWHAAGRLVNGVPAVYEAFLRPDAVHTSLVVGVAWMDTKLLRATLYSGSYIPGGGPYTYTAPVQPSAATSLVAAFNAGFRMADANGGYYTDGKMIMPLRTDGASVVIYKNGTVTVGAWGREVHMTSDVVSVRQNLSLLVDNGKPVAGLNANDTTVWGATLGNQVYVWRSGLGETAKGALVYVGGPGLNITTLAELLARAGSVRALELDINTDWVDYATFAPSTPHGTASPANGHNLLPHMVGTPARYFASWWARDFFIMSAR